MAARPLQPIVIWFGRVGDMIMLSALLGILHRRYGGPCYLIGAGSWPAELYAVHADVARVDCLRRYTALAFDRNWWRALGQLRARRGAPVYVCEFDRKKLRRVRRLLAMSGTPARHCLYLTQQPSWRETHWVDRLVSFGRLTPPAFDPAAYPWPSPPPLCAPHLEVAPAAREACEAWLRAAGLADAPLVLVQPGNRRTMRGRRLRLAPEDDRFWPLERWAQLLRLVHAHLPAARIVLCGAPREALLLGWIAREAQLPEVVVSAALPLARLLALCARAHSMISVNTGPAHLAAAVSLPVVVLFGAHSQAEWLPRSPRGAVIGLGGPPDCQRVDELSVERVFEAWSSLPQPAASLTAAARATAP